MSVSVRLLGKLISILVKNYTLKIKANVIIIKKYKSGDSYKKISESLNFP